METNPECLIDSALTFPFEGAPPPRKKLEWRAREATASSGPLDLNCPPFGCKFNFLICQCMTKTRHNSEARPALNLLLARLPVSSPNFELFRDAPLARATQLTFIHVHRHSTAIHKNDDEDLYGVFHSPTSCCTSEWPRLLSRRESFPSARPPRASSLK